MDEVWLVQRASDGDSGAFEEIFHAYHARIYRYVYRLVGNAEDAQDLTQDSFLRAYRALQRGAQPVSLSAWLYRIASNTCMDLLRRRHLIHWQPLENLLAVLNVNVAGARGPEEEVLQSERQAERQTEIAYVLAQLPPRYRMYLILREREGFSYQEISAITGDSLDTVKVTLYRARERARRIGVELRSGSEES
jgi:RNA polymerase sigma-70 factor (ECF subfamily)